MKRVICFLVCMMLITFTFAGDKKEYKKLNEITELINKMKAYLTIYIDGYIWYQGLQEGKELTTTEKNEKLDKYKDLKKDLKDLIKTLP